MDIVKRFELSLKLQFSESKCVACLRTFNILSPADAYMHQWTGLALAKVMAVQYQVNTWNKIGLLPIETLGTNFNENRIKMPAICVCVCVGVGGWGGIYIHRTGIHNYSRIRGGDIHTQDRYTQLQPDTGGGGDIHTQDRYTQLQPDTDTRIYLCIYVCVYVHVCVCVSVCARVCVCVWKLISFKQHYTSFSNNEI